MDHSKGNADGSPPQVSSDEIFSEDHNDTLERNPEDVLQKRFDTAYDQSGTQFQINEQISPKDIISELRGALLSLEEIIDNQKNSSPSSHNSPSSLNQNGSNLTRDDRAAHGESITDLSELLIGITKSTSDQKKIQELQTRLSNLIPKDPTPDTNKNAATENPTSWMHSGRTFSTVEEASTSTDENQPHEKTEYSVNDDEQLRPFSTVQSVATLKSITIDGEENFEKAAANEHDGYTASHQTSPEPRSIGVFAGSVLLTARVALGIITGGTVTLIDGGRDLYVGTRDGIINKAALGASKLAAGAAILIGITSANPALLAGGAIIYSSCLLFEYRAAITLHGKRIWDWFKS